MMEAPRSALKQRELMVSVVLNAVLDVYEWMDSERKRGRVREKDRPEVAEAAREKNRVCRYKIMSDDGRTHDPGDCNWRAKVGIIARDLGC